MNRFQSALRSKRATPTTASTLSFDLPSALFRPSAQDSARTLFVPEHYEPNYGYPLVVWLHHPGDDEWQLLRVMPLVSLRNYVAVAPRGVRIAVEAGEETWGWPEAADDLDDAQQRVFDAIEAVRAQYHVNSQRVFLVGSGCGGTMALRMAVDWPERFAGAASIGGSLPCARETPLSQWKQVRRLPVFLAVGSRSTTYPPAHACEDLRLLRIAGLSSITLREYHPCTNPLIPQTLRDVNGWIMEHVNASTARTSRRDRRSSCRDQ